MKRGKAFASISKKMPMMLYAFGSSPKWKTWYGFVEKMCGYWVTISFKLAHDGDMETKTSSIQQIKFFYSFFYRFCQ
jgi:hypothetical protein